MFAKAISIGNATTCISISVTKTSTNNCKIQWKVEKFEPIFILDWYWQILFIHYQISCKIHSSQLYLSLEMGGDRGPTR